jgi:uncharacterized protein YndB with AHSA1/START domain
MGLAGALAKLTAIVLVLGLLAGGAGFLLPREQTIESKTVILAPPEQVFDFITDIKDYERWRNDVSSVTVEDGKDPPGWSETASGFPFTFRVVKRERPKRFEVEFESSSGFQGRRTYELEPTDSGDRTKVKRTDVFEIANPLRRVYSYLAINLQRMVDAQLEDMGGEFLGALDKHPAATPTGSPPVGSVSTTPSPTATSSPASTAPGAVPTPTAAAPATTSNAPSAGVTPPSTTPAVPNPTATVPASSRPAATGSPSPAAPAGPALLGPSSTVPAATPSASGSPSASVSPTPSRI